MADWEHRINLKEIWEDYNGEKIDVVTAGKRVAEVLKSFKSTATMGSFLRDELDDIIFNFEHLSEDEEDFNNVMEELYDWGDTEIPTPPGKMQRRLAWIAFQF